MGGRVDGRRTGRGGQPRSNTAMTLLELERETALDVLVNVVPLAILFVLDLLFWVVNPWGWDPLFVVVAHFLTLFPLTVLAILTYVSARVIQDDERGGVVPE